MRKINKISILVIASIFLISTCVQADVAVDIFPRNIEETSVNQDNTLLMISLCVVIAVIIAATAFIVIKLINKNKKK